MSDISRIILNTMLYEINNSNTSKSVSNNESFSKLLQSSIGLLGSSSSDCSCSNSGVSSLGMIVTLTGLINQNRIYESNSNINNNLENLINLEEEKIKLQKELKQLENKNNSFNIAKEVLQIAYEKMKNNVTPKFTKNLSQTINKISNGKYNKVTINDEEGLMVELENGEYITADRLSIGTIDQLYLSLRLSMAEEISEEKMPVILDEAFAYFDDYRLENALKFLVEELEENQIILFTCTKREEEILNRLNIKYNLIEL